MNIDEQFEDFLAGLGVEMERPEDRQLSSDAIPEISIFQASRDHYGVFYRLDIVDHKPELRIMVPVEKGQVKMDIFLVRLSDRTSLNVCFNELSLYEGSAAYEHGREAIHELSSRNRGLSPPFARRNTNKAQTIRERGPAKHRASLFRSKRNMLWNLASAYGTLSSEQKGRSVCQRV